MTDRENFEAWCEGELNLRSSRLATGDYQSFGADMAWRAWQKARSSLVTAFEAKKLAVGDEHDDWPERECWNNGITACQCVADPSIMKGGPLE